MGCILVCEERECADRSRHLDGSDQSHDYAVLQRHHQLVYILSVRVDDRQSTVGELWQRLEHDLLHGDEKLQEHHL